MSACEYFPEIRLANLRVCQSAPNIARIRSACLQRANVASYLQS